MSTTSVGTILFAFADEGGAHKADAMAFSADLALFTLIVFIGLLLILGKFAWKPIMEGLAKREKMIADQIESAKRANDQAQASLRSYEEKLAGIAQQANDIIADAKKESLAAKERILAEASAEAKKQGERAVAEIRAAKDAAVRELAERSAESAVQLAGSIVGRSLNANDHQRLIDESIERFVHRG